MENEIKSLLQNKGINVVKITSEYEECIGFSVRFDNVKKTTLKCYTI